MASLLNIFGEYRTILGRAHRNVRYFFLASFLAQIGGGFSGILYNLYIKSLGLPDPVAGACVSAGSIAGAISLVPAGILSDRFGRKRAMVSAGVLTGVVAILQAFLHTPALLVVGSFASGLVGSVVWVSALPLLAENTEKDERLHLFSVSFGVGLVAQILGSLVGGALSQTLTKFGVSTVWSIRLTLLLGAVLSLASVLPFSRITSTGKAVGDKAKASLRQTFGQLRARRQQFGLIGRFTATSAFIGFGAGLVIPYMNLYFSERFHLPRAGIGLVIALGQALTATAMILGPATAKRLGPVRAVVTFQLISIPFLLITGWSMSLGFVCVAVIIRNALMNASNPIQDSIMMALVDDDLKGFAVSCGQTMFTLGWAIMGPISTTIVHRAGPYTGYATVFSMTAVLYLFGSIFYVLSFHKHQHKVYSGAGNSMAS